MAVTIVSMKEILLCDHSNKNLFGSTFTWLCLFCVAFYQINSEILIKFDLSHFLE